MSNFVYTQVTYITLVISGLLGLGVGLTASALRYKTSAAVRKQQAINPLTSGIIFLFLGTLAFLLVLLSCGSINGTLFNGWTLGYVVGVVIESLIFSGICYFTARKTIQRLT